MMTKEIYLGPDFSDTDDKPTVGGSYDAEKQAEGWINPEETYEQSSLLSQSYDPISNGLSVELDLMAARSEESSEPEV